MGKAVEHPGGFEGWLKDFSAKNPDASPEAIEAVHRYTGNDYDAINSALRGSGGIPTSVNDTIRNAEKVFDQLPASPRKTLRGTTLPQEVWDNMSRTGKFSDPAFLSTSTDPQVAKNLLESSRKLAPHEIPVTLEIEGRSGVDISRFSQYGHEAETLYRPGTSFDVVDKVLRDGVWRVKIREGS